MNKVVVRRRTTQYWECPHCGDEIAEKSLGFSDGAHFHRPCGGALELPQQDMAKISPEWRDAPSPRSGRAVVRTPHADNRELVYDTGERVMGECTMTGTTTGTVTETFTTGAIAISSGLNPAPQRTSKMASPKFRMDQPGSPIGGRKLDHDKTGAPSGTATKEMGKSWPRKLKNDGGQFEKLGGSRPGDMKGGVKSEDLSPEGIAAQIVDEGANLQDIFNSYARGVNYVSLADFRGICEAYGASCDSSKTLQDMMEANREFMFVPGQDAGGQFWVPQLIGENAGNFGGKQAKPFGKKDDEDDGGGEMDSEGDGKEGCDPEAEDCPMEGRARRSGTLTEAPYGGRGFSGQTPGFQVDEPEEHFGKFRDPNYGGEERDLPDFPIGLDVEEDEIYDPTTDFAGGNPENFDDLTDTGEGNGPGGAGFGGEGADYGMGGDRGDSMTGGIETCPECGGGAMYEMGCPECGYSESEGDPAGGGMSPDEIVSGAEEAGVWADHYRTREHPIDRMAHDNIDAVEGDAYDFYDAESGDEDFYESYDGQGNLIDESVVIDRPGLLAEHDGVAMDGPTGNGVVQRSGDGKDSGLPKTKTDTTGMGKEWPRRLKNDGGTFETFGDSRHGEASDGHQTNVGDIGLGKKLKNSGGQWEQFKSGRMGGGASKVYESVQLLSRHVRDVLREYVERGGLAGNNGKYQVQFSVSADNGAGDNVKPKRSGQLAEALADVEELLQVFRPGQVRLEAHFFGSGGERVGRTAVPLIRVPARGPVVSEGTKHLFRFPEVAQAYADRVVSEGRVCRAVTHNWGAAVSGNLNYNDASRIFKGLRLQ